MTVTLVAVVLVALFFDFTNGFHDTANSIATSVSTRALSPRNAVAMAAILNFVGAFIWFGYARTRAVEDALDRGSFAPVGTRLPLALFMAGAVLGTSVVLIVLFAH